MPSPLVLSIHYISDITDFGLLKRYINCLRKIVAMWAAILKILLPVDCNMFVAVVVFVVRPTALNLSISSLCPQLTAMHLI